MYTHIAKMIQRAAKEHDTWFMNDTVMLFDECGLGFGYIHTLDQKKELYHRIAVALHDSLEKEPIAEPYNFSMYLKYENILKDVRNEYSAELQHQKNLSIVEKIKETGLPVLYMQKDLPPKPLTSNSDFRVNRSLPNSKGKKFTFIGNVCPMFAAKIFEDTLHANRPRTSIGDLKYLGTKTDSHEDVYIMTDKAIITTAYMPEEYQAMLEEQGYFENHPLKNNCSVSDFMESFYPHESPILEPLHLSPFQLERYREETPWHYIPANEEEKEQMVMDSAEEIIKRCIMSGRDIFVCEGDFEEVRLSDSNKDYWTIPIKRVGFDVKITMNGTAHSEITNENIDLRDGIHVQESFCTKHHFMLVTKDALYTNYQGFNDIVHKLENEINLEKAKMDHSEEQVNEREI